MLAHVDDLPSGHDRYMAQLIDTLIVLGVGAAILATTLTVDNGVAASVSIVAAIVGGFFYEVVGLSVWGCTLGKRLRGMRVADLETGRNPGLAQATLRCLLAGFGLGSWYGIWINRTHRPFYDRLAGTIVVFR